MNCCVCGVEITDNNIYPSCIKRHHYICKLCQNKANKKNKKRNSILYKERHKEDIKKYNSEYASRPEVVSHRKEYSQQYYLNNKELILTRNSNWWKSSSGKEFCKKHNAVRREMGFIPLNDCSIDGWVGHHLDLDYVIFIPEELHTSTYHSVTKDINMNIINDKVYEWFVDYYFKGV